jgi:hypothetical protein
MVPANARDTVSIFCGCGKSRASDPTMASLSNRKPTCGNARRSTNHLQTSSARYPDAMAKRDNSMGTALPVRRYANTRTLSRLGSRTFPGIPRWGNFYAGSRAIRGSWWVSYPEIPGGTGPFEDFRFSPGPPRFDFREQALTDRGTARIRIGISSCLLGEKVRFDGGHKKDDFLTNRFG